MARPRYFIVPSRDRVADTDTICPLHYVFELPSARAIAKRMSKQKGEQRVVMCTYPDPKWTGKEVNEMPDA